MRSWSMLVFIVGLVLVSSDTANGVAISSADEVPLEAPATSDGATIAVEDDEEIEYYEEEVLGQGQVSPTGQLMSDIVSANLIARLLISANPSLPVGNGTGQEEEEEGPPALEIGDDEELLVVELELEGVTISAVLHRTSVWYVVDDHLCTEFLALTADECSRIIKGRPAGFFDAVTLATAAEGGEEDSDDDDSESVNVASRSGLLLLAGHAGPTAKAAHALLHSVATYGHNALDTVERAVVLEQPQGSSDYEVRDEDLMIGQPVLTEEEQETEKAMLNELKMPFDAKLYRDYFGVADDVKFPLTPQRFKASELTQESFEYFIRRGEPIVVSLPEEWAPMHNWTCDFFSQEYPDQEVSGWGDYGSTSGRKKMTMKLRDMKEILAIKETLGTEEERKQEGSATVMSWFWWPIGAEEEGTDFDDPVPQRLIQAFKKLPHFFRQTELNQVVLTHRMEQFFGLENSGARPHVDEVCDTIISVQSSGSKYWRLSMTPSVSALEAANPGYKWQEWHQETLGVRQIDKHPLFHVDLQAGEMLVFPPGLVHGTKVTQTCSVSTSLQLGEPLPSDFYQHFYQRLNNNPTVTSCFNGNWNSAIYGGVPYPVAPLSNKLFELFDLDKDGSLNKAELTNIFLAAGPIGSIDDEEDKRAAEMEAFQRTYDSNKDGLVSRAEFLEVNSRIYKQSVQEQNRLHGLNTMLKAWFKKIDLNEDNTISKDEWKLFGSAISWHDVSAISGGGRLVLEHFQEGLMRYVTTYLQTEGERSFVWD